MLTYCIQEDETGEVCSTHGRDEKLITGTNFGWRD